METNKVINLPLDEKFDVSEFSKNHRILYFPSQRQIIIKCSREVALRDNKEKFDGKAIVLTKGQAPRSYPDVFTNTGKSVFEGEKRSILLKVPKEMYLFCCRHGNVTAYLKGLIEREMKK